MVAETAKNALAGRPLNALAVENRYDPTEVYDFLINNKRLPAWVQSRPYSDRVSGEYFPEANALLARNPSNGSSRATLAHEMTHAATQVMTNAAAALREKEFNGGKLTDGETQFLRAYLNAIGNLPGRMAQYNSLGNEVQASKNITKQAMALGGAQAGDSKEYLDYRLSPKELYAFGVGNSYQRDSSAGEPLHLNPTAATQFSILMDMYQRLPQTTRDTVSAQIAAREAKMTDRFKDIPNVKYTAPVFDYPNPFAK